MKNKTQYKLTLLFLKYIPVIMFLLMWLYMICAVFSIPLAFSSTIVGCSLLPTLLIFALSSVFQFCWVHKTLTIYAFIADVLINLNKLIGFGSAVLFLKWIMVIVGFIIFLILLFKINKLTTACPKIKRDVFR
jgi:hypothetical protein